MTPSCAELGETCAATTVALGIVVFVSATYAAATFRPVMPILIWIGVAATRDATLAKCRCVEARAEKNVLYHSAGVVDTRHFAKIRVSQGDLRSKINRHDFTQKSSELLFRPEGNCAIIHVWSSPFVWFLYPVLYRKTEREDHTPFHAMAVWKSRSQASR